MTDDKEYDKRDNIGENKEETLNTDIELLNMRKLSSKKCIYNVDKESDERHHMDISDDKEFDERDKIGEMMNKE